MFDKIFDTRFASAVKYPAEEVQAWPRPVHIPFFQFDLHPVNLCTNYHYPTDIHDEERMLFFKTQTYALACDCLRDGELQIEVPAEAAIHSTVYRHVDVDIRDLPPLVSYRTHKPEVFQRDGADDWEILCEDCTEFYTGICCTFETEIEALTVAAEHARMNLIAVIPEEETVILPDGESIGIKINKTETQSRD